MAAPHRRQRLDLIRALEAAPHRYGFFQALRLLARRDPELAGLRLRTPAGLAFPAAELLGARRVQDRLDLEVGFLGLTGPAGVLPYPYTEWVVERMHGHRDGTLHGFLDLFSHRACCLLFQAWRKYSFPILHEASREDPATACLRALLPLPGPGAGVPIEALLFQVGSLARRPLSAWALAALVSSHFRTPARIEGFAGQWLPIPPGGQARLGGASAGLGAGAFLGERLWDPQTRFRLCLGPLPGRAFQNLLPGRAGGLALADLLRRLVGRTLGCDLALAPRPAALPPMRLDRRGVRLGLDTWLRSRPLAPAPVVFRLLA